MTEQETYIERQKNCGIEVGDRVRLTRKAVSGEGGWDVCWVSDFDIGTERVVDRINSTGIHLDGDVYYPYFVLEIVKKANGDVPGKTEPKITGESTMKNGRFDIEIVKEKTDDKGKTTNGIVVKRYTKFHVDAAAAREYAKMKHGLVILAEQDAGFEVDILVHNFCG